MTSHPNYDTPASRSADTIAEIGKLFRFRDTGKISEREACENSIYALVRDDIGNLPEFFASLPSDAVNSLKKYVSKDLRSSNSRLVRAFLPADSSDLEFDRMRKKLDANYQKIIDFLLRSKVSPNNEP